MSKTLKIEVKGATTIDYRKLEPFQGDLKALEREEYEAMRESLLKNGFSFTIHVWKSKGKNYIIDGHQRLFTVKKMAEDDGYKIPALPVSVVSASSFKAAKMKILAGVSTYGKMTADSLAAFLKENDLPLDDVALTFKFPNLDVAKIIEDLGDSPEPGGLDDVEAAGGGSMRSAGDGVKQLQLFFDEETYEEFVKNVGILSNKYEKENVSDTLVEVVRAAVKGLKKK